MISPLKVLDDDGHCVHADLDAPTGRPAAGEVLPMVPGHPGSVHLDQRPGRQQGRAERAAQAAAR